ncbi:hypothetical protein KAW65_00325 [candidate division WOR-3 bacterium]|nr:hypothetical protein [candidate division WOR-3 bacterium]
MITIRLCKSKSEYQKICNFVEEAYREKWCIRYLEENPQVFFVALNKSDIIGTVGLYLKSVPDKLPAEIMFDFKIKEFSELSCNKTAEISRLVIKNKEYPLILTKGLFVALYLYAKKHNIETTVASVKPSLMHFLQNHLKLPVHTSNKRIKRNAIPNQYEEYFLKEPFPVPIILYTRETAPCFEAIKKSLFKNITFHI